MGIGGSGLASSIAEWFSVLIMVGGVFIAHRRRDFNLFHIKKINFGLIWQMTKVSSPLVFQSVIANGAWFLFFTYIEKMGQDKLAISSILRQLLMFIGIPVWALGSVTNTIVSNLAGQNNLPQVRIAIKKISVMSMIMIGIQLLILLAIPTTILHLFTNNGLLVQEAIPSLWVLSGALVLMSFTLIIFNAVVSIGDTTHYALYVEVAAVIIYCSYFLFLFHIPGIQLAYVWTGEWVYWLTMLLFSVLLLRRQKVKLFL
jgi:Na+-driven multidrug efflux pump